MENKNQGLGPGTPHSIAQHSTAGGARTEGVKSALLEDGLHGRVDLLEFAQARVDLVLAQNVLPVELGLARPHAVQGEGDVGLDLQARDGACGVRVGEWWAVDGVCVRL
jgi:hypothetical protein